MKKGHSAKNDPMAATQPLLTHRNQQGLSVVRLIDLTTLAEQKRHYQRSVGQKIPTASSSKSSERGNMFHSPSLVVRCWLFKRGSEADVSIQALDKCGSQLTIAA